MKHITKYRPSLTASQIRWIVDKAKTSSPLTEEAYSIIAVLDPFLTKISNSSITPAYTVSTKAKANSLESLGGNIDKLGIPRNADGSIPISSNAISDGIPYAAGTVDKLAYWEQCYNKWLDCPASCSLVEITNAQEHRYLNDLMSAEELAEFEQAQFTAYNQ